MRIIWTEDMRRVQSWIKRAGRVRWERLNSGEFKVSTEKQTRSVVLTEAELNEVKATAGAIALGTM